LIVVSFFKAPQAHLHSFPQHHHQLTNKSTKYTNTKIPCPSILSGPPTVSLSVVVPAYNEEGRLPATLDEVLPYLQRRHQQGQRAGGAALFTWEVIVVDDGSRDGTARVALDYARRFPPAAAAGGGGGGGGAGGGGGHNGRAGSAGGSGGAVRVLRLPRNRGKGMAVREGALASRGALVLFCDADGATRFSDVELLERALDGCCASSFGGKAGSAAGAVRAGMAEAAARGLGVVNVNKAAAAAAATGAGARAGATLPADPRGPVGAALGSRAHLQAAAVQQRAPLRNALMHGFHFAVRLAAGEGVVAPSAAKGGAGGGGGKGEGGRQQQHNEGGIRDTQCGFKLATRRAAASLFANQRLQRWCFDVELALLASRLGVPLREVGVCWTEMPGSKIRPTSVLHMAFELLVLRLAYGVLPAVGLRGWRVHGEADASGAAFVGGRRGGGLVDGDGSKEE
jgi:dolichyl-phosphate beta-glucosyltransferase